MFLKNHNYKIQHFDLDQLLLIKYSDFFHTNQNFIKLGFEHLVDPNISPLKQNFYLEDMVIMVDGIH